MPEETSQKKKQPIYKKWWLWVILVVVIFGPIFSSMDDEDESTSEENKEEQQEETDKSEGQEKEKLDKKIDLEDEFLFTDFSIYMDEAHIYEEDGQAFMDLSFDWINDSFEDKTTFMRASSIDVHQNDELLTETTDAYSDTNSDVYFPNAVGGKWGIELTYKLVDSESPVRIVFVPHGEMDENKELTIEIK